MRNAKRKVRIKKLVFKIQSSHAYNSIELIDYINAVFNNKACGTRELSAELTVTRAYWRKQVPPVCGGILRVFRHACQKSLKILSHTGGIFLTPMVTSEFLLVCGRLKIPI